MRDGPNIKIVALDVSVPIQLKSLNLDVLRVSYKFLSEADLKLGLETTCLGSL